jgi:hypothetical protein
MFDHQVSEFVPLTAAHHRQHPGVEFPERVTVRDDGAGSGGARFQDRAAEPFTPTCCVAGVGEDLRAAELLVDLVPADRVPERDAVVGHAAERLLYEERTGPERFDRREVRGRVEPVDPRLQAVEDLERRIWHCSADGRPHLEQPMKAAIR